MSDQISEKPPVQMQALHKLATEMAAIRDSHPEWYAAYEDEDPMTASQDTLRQLLDSAPNAFAGGLILGITLLRQQIAIITDRPF